MNLCLASLHPRRLSGQVESVVALARELARRGHEVQLVTAFESSTSPDREIRPVGSELGATAIGKLVSLLRSIVRLAASTREADLIHLNLPTPAFSFLADVLQLWTGCRIPIVVGYEAHLADVRQLVCEGLVWRDPRFYLPRVLINNGLMGRWARYGCQRYVVASHWQRTELYALGVPEERIVTLPNLIDRDKLQPLGHHAARQTLFGANLAGPVIGWAGHFHHVKGVDVLLQAFHRLSRERPAAQLALAWSGIGDVRQTTREIRALGLRERVVRLGRVDMAQLFSAVDVLALPYRLTIGQGAFPNLVMEAMAVGVPLVTADLPLLRELTSGGRTALLVRPGDPAALYAGLDRLLGDSSLAGPMVEAQRDLMDGPLSPSLLADRYEDLYASVLTEVS